MRWRSFGSSSGVGGVARVLGTFGALAVLLSIGGLLASPRASATAVSGVLPTMQRASASPATGGAWSWPLPTHALAAPYAAPPTRYAAGHRGIDLGSVAGVAVTAPDDGVVRFAGVVVDRPVLTLDHGDGVLSSFEPVLSDLPVGATVGRGAVVGVVAAGGHCDASCLHVGVRRDGEYVSPMLYFGRLPPAVLLPLGSG